MLIRLCWKEWRRGWPLLVLGLLLPPLAVALDRRHVTLLGLNMVAVMLFLLQVGVVLWASTLVADGKSRSSFAATHLPLHPGCPLFITLCTQGLLVALLGLSLGWWTAKLPHALPLPLNMELALCYLLAAFLLTLVIARTISLPAAMATGVLWVLYYGNEPFRQLALPAQYGYDARPIPLGLYLPLCILVGSLALGLLMITRHSLAVRRIAAAALVVAFAIGYPVAMPWLQQRNQTFPYQCCQFEDVNIYTHTADGSVAVLQAPDAPASAQKLKLQFIDYRVQRCVSQTFSVPVKVLGIIGRRSAVLLGQRASDKWLTLSQWDFANNTVQMLTAMPAREESFFRILSDSAYYRNASFSPDGRFVLLCLPTLQRQDPFIADLWLVDMAGRQARVVIVDRGWADLPPVSWVGERAIFTNNRQPFAVTAPDGTITGWQLPAVTEARR